MSFHKPPTRSSPRLFLHCVDARVESNGSWYSRLHLGPFWLGSGLQVGTRIRRSLLNDLSQVSIIAVKLDGAVHEFSRLSGVYETVLDLLFQFRKRILHAPDLKVSDPTIIPFFFTGPGEFYTKDIPWTNRVQCNNPHLLIATLTPGSFLRGHLLIQKNTPNDRNILRLGEPWVSSFRCFNNRTDQFSSYPWLSLGFPSKPVERVRFRIEPMGPLHQQYEVVIFEILTNGSLSPRQALREAALLLVQKFSAITNIILSLPFKRKPMSAYAGQIGSRSGSKSSSCQ